MKLIKTYLLLASLIGFLQILDGIILYSQSGKAIFFNHIVSMVEAIWILISIISIALFRRNKLSVLSPVSLIVYEVLGWCAGAVIVLKAANQNISLEVLPIPLWAAVAGIIFGAYYIVVNACLYKEISSD